MTAFKFAFGMLLASAAVLSAQEEAVPKYEIGFNYSGLHVSSSSNNGQRTGNGGSGTFEYNVNGVLGVVADLGGYANTRFDNRLFTYMFGPRLNFRHSRLTPYVQALFGGAHLSYDFSGTSTTQNAFAFATGGGVDYNLSKHISIKPVQVEYVLTRFNNIEGFGSQQNDVRYSAGVVFRLGER